MPIICLLGLLLLLLLQILETLSILVIGSWIPHARSTGARRALRWSARPGAVLLRPCWSAHLGAVLCWRSAYARDNPCRKAVRPS